MPASTIRSNSSRVVKLYSRPLDSEPRGARVVQETAKSTPLSCLRSSLTSVLLPEPEGAEMIKRIPATFRLSFRELRFPFISARRFHPLQTSHEGHSIRMPRVQIGRLQIGRASCRG